MMRIPTLIIITVLIFNSFACKEKRSSQTLEVSPDSKDYREKDYEKVQGIVLKIFPNDENASSSNTKNDIFYVYNIDQNEPEVGIEKNSDSRFSEDDLVMVMVNKENSSLSFIDRRGMVNQEVLYKYLTRTDSSYYRLKDEVPFD